jgi:glyoxylase I family protein
MNSQIQASGIHHFTLTVTDLDRSVAFYRDLLGFQIVLDLGERKIMSNGSILLVVATPPDPVQALAGDRFSENRVGLDHISFTVASRADLEEASRFFDNQGVAHGEIKDLGPDLGIYVMAFRDPDNIQLELTAPYG